MDCLAFGSLRRDPRVKRLGILLLGFILFASIGIAGLTLLLSFVMTSP
jgi:hypothetical protein